MPNSVYDPSSPNEQPVALPSTPTRVLSPSEVLQPPLSRRGTGPGIILFLPPPDTLCARTTGAKPLDPEPVKKWAEEGYAVVGIAPDSAAWSFGESLKRAIAALLSLKELDTRDKFGAVVYDPSFLLPVSSALSVDSRLVCLVGYGTATGFQPAVPTLLHFPSATKSELSFDALTIHSYPVSSPFFVLPQTSKYVPGSAALAHSRSLVFLRKWLAGPFFDLEAVWDEHTYFEFQDRSVAKTMGTMVAEPYVNHVPTMTGGIGREDLTAFYRDHFIFSNPADASLEVISRTVGPDRVVDEFIYKCTHDCVIDAILPGVPPSGNNLAIPMVAIVNIRGDRLYNEHIWWDQATALRQAGILPTHLAYPTADSPQRLRLPVAGAECAAMLLDEANGRSNEMLGDDWGLNVCRLSSD